MNSCTSVTSVNGWHEAYNDFPGPDVMCGHLAMIAVPPAPADAPAACQHCLDERTTWVGLRRCQAGGEPWGWCFADGMPLTPDQP